MEYRLLGPLEVLDAGRPLDLGAPRQRAVLAFLLLHANEVVPSDRLAEALWPDGIPKTAAKAIQVYVSALRKALGPSRDVLETRGPGYVLRVAPGELDLHAFERLLARARGEEPAARVATLGAALALWRGAPLADFAYEAFVQPEAARLEELRQLAVEERLEAELELGGGSELIAELQALVAERPLQERPRALLMRALYRAGRQSDALDVFRAGRQLLDEELGLEPGARAARARARHPPAGPGARRTARAIEEPVARRSSPCRSAATGVACCSPLAEALARGPRPRELVLARIVPAAELGEATRALDDARRELAARRERARRRVLVVGAGRRRRPARGSAGRRPAARLAPTAIRSRARSRAVFDRATCDVASLVERGGRGRRRRRSSSRSERSSTTGRRSSSARGPRRRSTVRCGSSARPTGRPEAATRAGCSPTRP